MCCFFVLCYVPRPPIHLFLQMLKYVLPYKCKCIMISNTFNFLKLKIRSIHMADPVQDSIAIKPCICYSYVDGSINNKVNKYYTV